MSQYNESQVSKTIDLNLKGIKKKDWQKVKKEIGEFIVDSILDKVSDGETPVANQKDFKDLSKNYADSKKGGNRTANLDLKGDMLNALDFRIGGRSSDSIEVGVFKKSQAPKALGHNTGALGTKSGKRSLVRRFIPKKSQSFDSEIKKGIRDILKEFRNG